MLDFGELRHDALQALTVDFDPAPPNELQAI